MVPRQLCAGVQIIQVVHAKMCKKNVHIPDVESRCRE